MIYLEPGLVPEALPDVAKIFPLQQNYLFYFLAILGGTQGLSPEVVKD